MDRVGQVARQLLRDRQEHREDRVPAAPGAREPPRLSASRREVARPSRHRPVFCDQRANPKTGEVSDAPVTLMDVYQEFNELSERFKIMKYKSKVRVNARQGVGASDTPPRLKPNNLFSESGEELRF